MSDDYPTITSAEVIEWAATLDAEDVEIGDITSSWSDGTTESTLKLADSDVVWSESVMPSAIDMRGGQVDLPTDTRFDGKTIQELIQQQLNHQPKQEVQAMWTTSNILIVVLIVIITTKIILPRLNWRWVLGKFKNVVYRPTKKQIDEAEKTWKEV